MILASIDWLSITINLLLILFVLVALLMSLLILMQRPKQQGLGAAFGSGMTDQMFGARTTNVLQKGTVYLGSLFFILTLTLAILFARKNERDTSKTLVKEDLPAEEQVMPPAVEEPEPTPSLEESLEGQLGSPGEETPADGTAEESGETTSDNNAEETPAEDPPADDAPAEDTPVEEGSAGEGTTEPAGEGTTEPAGEGTTEPAGEGTTEPAGEEPGQP